MAKKKPGMVPNRHIYTRISFLYQASAYLAHTGKQPPVTPSHNTAAIPSADADVSMGNDDAFVTQGQLTKSITVSQNLSRKLLTDLRAVTLKSVIRASPHVKRSICKYCDTLLVDGQTCSSLVENKSKGGKKSWADVLVVKCHTCGGEKRFPVCPRELKARKHRIPRGVEDGKSTKQEPGPSTQRQTADSQTA